MSPQKKINAVNITFLVSVLISVTFSVIPVIVYFINLSFGTSIDLPLYVYIEEHPVVNILCGQGIIAIPLIAFLAVNRINYPKLIHLKKMKVSNILLSILLGILIQPLLTFFNALSLVFTDNAVSSTIFELSNQVPFIVGVLLVCILPGLLEESMYRGALFQSYKAANPWKAVILSGFLFGIMHGNLNQFTYAFVLGMVFALIVEATGSILSTMIIHLCTNLISVVTVYVLPKLYVFLQSIVASAEESGDQILIDQIQGSVGDTSLPVDEWLQTMLNSGAEASLSFGQVIFTYLPSAVIFTVLAFLVLTHIAKRSGTWDKFRVTYLGADEVIVEASQKGPYDKELETIEKNGDSTLRIMTVPLMIAIAVSIMFMFFAESLKYLPQ